MMKRILSVLSAFLLTVCCSLPVYAADEIKVRRVEISSAMTVRVGQTRVIPVLITPSNADDKSITWTCSNEEIVAFVDDGVIAGISPGTAVITVEAANGRKAECTVTVPGNALKEITLDTENIDLPVYENGGELLTAYELRTAVEKASGSTQKGKTAIVAYKDKSELSAAALRSASYAAELGSRTVSMRFDTTDKNGSVQGQIRIDPALAKGIESGVKLGVYTSPEKTDKIKSGFEKKNSRVEVIRCAQQGGYGMAVEIAAKISTDRLDTSNLRFYSYDDSSNTYRQQINTSYWIDANGYLHLKTERGGNIVISDTAL